jgi:hypothetical protein
MHTPKDIHSEHTENNNYVDKDSLIISTINRYEEFIKEALVSGVPLWLLSYHDGMPETYTKDTDDDRH